MAKEGLGEGGWRARLHGGGLLCHCVCHAVGQTGPVPIAQPLLQRSAPTPRWIEHGIMSQPSTLSNARLPVTATA
jgi:hypothetical protein